MKATTNLLRAFVVLFAVLMASLFVYARAGGQLLPRGKPAPAAQGESDGGPGTVTMFSGSKSGMVLQPEPAASAASNSTIQLPADAPDSVILMSGSKSIILVPPTSPSGAPSNRPSQQKVMPYNTGNPPRNSLDPVSAGSPSPSSPSWGSPSSGPPSPRTQPPTNAPYDPRRPDNRAMAPPTPPPSRPAAANAPLGGRPKLFHGSKSAPVFDPPNNPPVQQAAPVQRPAPRSAEANVQRPASNPASNIGTSTNLGRSQR